jgi:hypothetical protein
MTPTFVPPRFLTDTASFQAPSGVTLTLGVVDNIYRGRAYPAERKFALFKRRTFEL